MLICYRYLMRPAYLFFQSFLSRTKMIYLRNCVLKHELRRGILYFMANALLEQVYDEKTLSDFRHR